MLNLKRLANLLAAKKISLNEWKVQFILFRSARQLHHTQSNIKFSNFVLEQVKSMTYLLIEIDEALSYNKQTENLSKKKKLSRENSFSSKSIYYALLQALVSSCYALFYSYSSYGLSA